MRGSISINLASEPFRRDRPFFVAAVAATTILAALLALQVFYIWVRHGEADQARAAVNQVDKQLQASNAEQARIQAVLRQPANSEALDYSLFLNGLLRRKSISWTRLFADLERVMPHNVRLVNVRPQVNLDNQILLDMTVGSQTGTPVLDLLLRLESSPVFGQTWVSSKVPPTQSEPLYRYRVNARYAPKP